MIGTRQIKMFAPMIYAEGLAFNLVKSPYVMKVVESIENFGRGYAPLSYHEAKVIYLQKEVEKINKIDVEKYMEERSRVGCTLISEN